MKTDDFNYDLPDELIAQYPIQQRDLSRLMVLDRLSGKIAHKQFFELPKLLNENDLLIFNNTRVIPARLFCTKKETGAQFEFLFTTRISAQTWRCIAKKTRRLTLNTIVTINENPRICLKVTTVHSDGSRELTLLPVSRFTSLDDVLEHYGHIPLPPYIERKAEAADKDTYQTIYAREPGAIAAPTAGLHFTDAVLEKMHNRGVATATITLHVGIGTFRPVTEKDPRDHPMHCETYTITPETVEAIYNTKKKGGRVVAVGTTSVRALEATCVQKGELKPVKNLETDLFILPGFSFKVVDALITNFHVPKSTLLMLVSAFSGRESILHAYETAVREKYRFLSYGDAMFIS